ncbi:hypothetical protein SAV14893_043860 [Streptomyces avermitilis]|uniref:Uncharacterized protein n=1 Tax=Streptomyces avermitilis TaxID=33903 RepID=A0A4D4M102_STRAX|nr:hypothetical protein SAV14893_043860 [Streptomyces avermitilis]GDY83843.1 hypothetical protein SAVCW2_30420 [Streptomyces avermitilis]
MQYATTAATARPSSSPDPAARAAGPSAAKIPAPTIDPSPTTTASPTPRVRRNPKPPDGPAPDCVMDRTLLISATGSRRRGVLSDSGGT